MNGAGLADVERFGCIERTRGDQHRGHADQRVEGGDQFRHRGHRHTARNHRTDGGADGNASYGSLLADGASNLYGMAGAGGNITNCNGQGCGVVFKLTPPAAGQTAWTEAVLYNFNGGTDGAYPYGTLIADGAGQNT